MEAILRKDGVEELEPVVTSKNTYVAPFVNAEETEYLVIENDFPNGRQKLEEGGVMFTDRTTVDKVEKMKVCTCLNPLHTCLAIFGCLLGYRKISDEMQLIPIMGTVIRADHGNGFCSRAVSGIEQGRHLPHIACRPFRSCRKICRHIRQLFPFCIGQAIAFLRDRKGSHLQYDIGQMREATKENPFWIHFGAGNLFRAFHAAIVEKMLNEGKLDRGLIVAEGFDYEIVEKMYDAHDNLGIAVTLKADGTIDKSTFIITSMILLC